MSRRCLISIGCDKYDEEKPLTGAEADARKVFDLLMRPEVGDYDPAWSHLLLSPTLAEIRDALRAILTPADAIETLTIFFAGHGGVKSGAFYLLPRDASTNLLAVTALSASELLSIVAEASPLQTNLIVDACQAGGFSSDIRSLLRPEDLGATETPGVTVLGMAARNEAALEVNDAGVGTTALLDCIEGRVFVSNNRPTLDLLDIGTRVAEIFATAKEQSPVIWGLNLFGPKRFCSNPSYGGSAGPLRTTLGDWHDASTRIAVETAMPKLWRMWDRLDDRDWLPREFVDELRTILNSLPTDISRAQLMERLNVAAKLKADGAFDRLRTLEVTATIIVASLQHITDDEVAKAARALARQVAGEAERIVNDAIIALENDRYALLSRRGGGISDFFVLPLRLTRLLGWAAVAYYIRKLDDKEAKADLLSRYINTMIEQAPASVIAISDTQAAPVACALVAAAQGTDGVEAETLLGILFTSAVQSGGIFASAHIESTEILRFLIARRSGNFDQIRSSLAQPTELLTVLLRGAALYNLADEFDPWLIQLDGTDLNAFLPLDYGSFGHDLISDGVNASYKIGHDIFTVSDLQTTWQEPPDPIGEQRTAAMLASLIFPDRTPWFLFPKNEFSSI